MKLSLLIFSLINLILYLVGAFLPDLKILQLEEYNILKLFKHNIKYCVVRSLLYLFPLLGLVSFLLNDYNTRIIYTFCTLSIMFVLTLILSIRSIILNIFPKYTKRIKRKITLFALLSITMLFVSILYNSKSCTPYIMTTTIDLLTIGVYLIINISECVLCCFYLNLASKKLNKMEIKKIAITGTYAKTSVKYMLSTLLEEKYSVISTPKSYNTANGLSMTIRNNDLTKYDIFIMEMGAKKKGDIKKLCKYFKPQYGVLTAIGIQHLETFKSVDSIAKTKRELQENLVGDSIMVFNCNNELVNTEYVNYTKNKISVGLVDASGVDDCLYNVYAVIKSCNLDGLSFDIYYRGKFFCFAQSSLIGEHNIINILLAVAMCIKLGLNGDQIRRGISKLQYVESRMQPIEIGDNILINNGYNSNPASADASLNLIKLYRDKYKIVITPGFVEMGKEQYSLNYEFGKKIARVANECYIVNLINKKAILDGLKSENFEGNVVLVDTFKQIDFSMFVNSVVLIENDLPENYV